MLDIAPTLLGIAQHLPNSLQNSPTLPTSADIGTSLDRWVSIFTGQNLHRRSRLGLWPLRIVAGAALGLKFGPNWPIWAEIGLRLAKLRPISKEFDPNWLMLAKFGWHFARLGQAWSNFDQNWPMGLESTKVGQFGAKHENMWPMLVELDSDQNWPNSAAFGRNRSEVGRHRSNFGRDRIKTIRSLPKLARTRTKLTICQTRPKLVEIGSRSAQIRSNRIRNSLRWVQCSAMCVRSCGGSS